MAAIHQLLAERSCAFVPGVPAILCPYGRRLPVEQIPELCTFHAAWCSVDPESLLPRCARILYLSPPRERNPEGPSIDVAAFISNCIDVLCRGESLGHGRVVA